MAESQTKSTPDTSSGSSGTSAPKTEKVVRYVGTADVREIDKAAFALQGVDDQSKVVWNSENRHTVKASTLSAGALKYLDEIDEGFVVEDVEV